MGSDATCARPTGPSRRGLLATLGGLCSTATLLTAGVDVTGGTTATRTQSAQPTARWQYAADRVSNTIGHDGGYYLTTGETVQAIDATTGKTEWTAGAGSPVREGAAAIDAEHDVLITASESGTALGVTLADGTERWRRSAGGAGIGVAVADGTAYLLAGSTVQAVEAASGDQLWSHNIPEAVGGQPKGLAVANTDAGVVPVYHTPDYLISVTDSGTEQWRLELPAPTFSSDVFAFNSNNIVSQGQYVYYQSDTGPNDGDRHGMVDATTGTLVWERLDDYTNLTELRGGPATFNGRVVNSGAEATVMSVPGGSTQWSTGITAYDSITGTSEALYVAGDAGGTATVRSFGAGGTINWTLEFGEFDEYASVYNEAYEFFNVPPAVADGSILVGARPEPGESGLRCYQLPESEWLAAPQRETTADDSAGGDEEDTDDPPEAGTQETDPPSSSSSTDNANKETAGTDRGFFTNGGDGPLSELSGTNLTVLSTAITVVGIVVTVYDLIRGGDD